MISYVRHNGRIYLSVENEDGDLIDIWVATHKRCTIPPFTNSFCVFFRPTIEEDVIDLLSNDYGDQVRRWCADHNVAMWPVTALVEAGIRERHFLNIDHPQPIVTNLLGVEGVTNTQRAIDSARVATLSQQQSEILSTIRRDYRGCFVRIKELNKDKTIDALYVQDVHIDSNGDIQFFGHRYNANGNRVRREDVPRSYKQDEVILSYPLLGMINSTISAHYIYRAPRRQWYRGLNSRNIIIKPNAVIDDGRPNGLGVNVPEIEKIAAAIFNKQYTDPKTALEGVLNAEYLSRAISRHYAISLVPKRDTPVLTYKRWSIGDIDENGCVTLKDSVLHLKEDVSQYLEVKA